MATTSLAALRAKRGSFDAINKKVENLSKKSGKQTDERMWQCATDDAKNGSAIIRFLPAPIGEEDEFVQMYTHGFKGPSGKWYVNNCLTTIGQEDPVVQHCSELWETGTEANQNIARQRKRKLSYYSNVLIVSDPANPENEGKVKLFRYGQKIFEKLVAVMKPEFDDEEPMNPFDPWDGANFRLKITEVAGYANFDKSSFAKPSPLAKTDEEIEEIWKQCHSLADIVSPDKFKSYDALKAELDKVLGNSAPAPKAGDTDLSDDDVAFLKANAKTTGKSKPAPADQDDADDEPPAKPAKVTPPKATPKTKPAAKIADEDLPSTGSDEDDDLAYFAKLAEE